MPLRAALKTYAKTQTDKLAVAIGARSISFGALYARGKKLNDVFANLPRQPRAFDSLKSVPLVAVHLGNHPAIPEVLVAALAGRCCVMLLDPLLPHHRTQEILDRLPPDIMLTAGSELDFQMAGPVMTLTSPASLDGLLATEAPRAADPAPSDPFMVSFTSGTTSTPKAFARDRASWQRSLTRGRDHFGMHPEISTLSPGPLAHGLSLYAFAETLEAGANFHTMDKFAAQACAELIASRNIQRLVCVPTMLEALVAQQTPLPALSKITTAGAKLSQNLLAEAQNLAANATLTEYYGASELGFVTTATHGTGIAAPQSVGTPFPGIDIEIRTPDADGNGEVWLRSDLIIDDYLWRDDAHGFRCVDGWSTVGDIGRLEAGALHLVGRAGGMVTSGGNNIYLDQVARHLDTHPDIKTALVLGIPDQYLGTKLVALIEPRAPALSAQDLVDYCQASLQKYKIPRAFFRVSDWPVTSSGKIATKELEMWVTEKDDRLAAL